MIEEAAWRTLGKEEKSTCMQVILTFGCLVLMFEATDWSLEGVREARMSNAGE